MGGDALKCKYMISIKVKIEGCETQQGVYFRQNLQGVKEGGAANDEINEALSPNRDEKEEASKGRFKVSRKARA